ncbi:MAG TPA: glycosyltransferase family 39 protein [Pirellulales bacterium]|nr:glycosyltransferase family 39 protein [Pirellulales bacterium]
MRAPIQHQLCILAAALVVFFTNLGGPRLWDDDEPRNATCAREMLARGDWVVPTFNSELRTDKPVLLYWLMMGSYALFGATEFAARFPSALLAVGTALMTYHLGRLLFRPQVGLWAGLIMATNLMFAVSARAATPDSTLIFFTTLSFLIYVWSVTGEKRGQNCLLNWGEKHVQAGAINSSDPFSWLPPWPALAAMYAAMGLAVLAKGPVGALLPCAAIGLFLMLVCARPSVRVAPPEHSTLLNLCVRWLWAAAARMPEFARQLPRAVWAMRPVLLATTVLAIALPWYLLVGLKTDWEWTSSFFLKHNLDRFMQPLGGHRGTILFHPLILIACFFPWSFLLPAGALQLVRKVRTGDSRRAAYLLVGSWIFVWFAVFSLAGTKLPSYVLPAYPALAVVCGAWAADWIAAPARRSAYRWVSIGLIALAVAGGGLAIGISLAIARWFPGVPGFGWIGLIAIAGAGVGWILHRRKQPAMSLGSLAVTAILLAAAAFAVAAVPLSRLQNGAQFAEMLQQIEGKPDGIGLFHVATTGVIYYADPPLHDFKEDRQGVQSFFARAECPVLVTDAEGYNAIRSLLPPDAIVIDRQPRFLKRGEMVVIGRAPSANVAALRRATAKDDATPLEAHRPNEATTHDPLRR